MTGLRHARSRRERDAGFLLTETLATFTISAFVLLGLVSASSVLLRSVDRNVIRIQDADDLGRTMKAIMRDISGLERARWNGYEPQAFVFRGGPNSVFFAIRQTAPDGSREILVVALREIVVGRGTRLMRGEARLSPSATGFDELHFGPQRELGTGSARLRFSYVRPADEKVERNRLREWPMSRALPDAVIVEAVTRDTGRLLMSMRVPIRANADIGCLSLDKGIDPGPISAVAPETTKASATTLDNAAQPTIGQLPAIAIGDGAKAGFFCGLARAASTRQGRQDPQAKPSQVGSESPQ